MKIEMSMKNDTILPCLLILLPRVTHSGWSKPAGQRIHIYFLIRIKNRRPTNHDHLLASISLNCLFLSCWTFSSFFLLFFFWPVFSIISYLQYFLSSHFFFCSSCTRIIFCFFAALFSLTVLINYLYLSLPHLFKHMLYLSPSVSHNGHNGCSFFLLWLVILFQCSLIIHLCTILVVIFCVSSVCSSYLTTWESSLNVIK